MSSPMSGFIANSYIVENEEWSNGKEATINRAVDGSMYPS
jgi:hypothetical protein